MKVSKFNEAINQLLATKLELFTSDSLNSSTCTQIYQAIFECLSDIFEKSNVELTNESVNYVAQQYYDSILVNGNQELDPNIFTQRASMDNISTKELALLAVMFSGTDYAIPLIHEVKRRG